MSTKVENGQLLSLSIHAFLYPETQQNHRQNVIFYKPSSSTCNHHPAAFCLFYSLFLKEELFLQNEHLNAR